MLHPYETERKHKRISVKKTVYVVEISFNSKDYIRFVFM